MALFVDTSAFYALADDDDQYHAPAKAFYEQAIARERLVTTDYVLLECWFLMRNRLGRSAAITFVDALRSGIVDLVKVESADLNQARDAFDRFADQDFSLVDATSFAVMEREGIGTAFTFDDHFRAYRFGERSERFFAVSP